MTFEEFYDSLGIEGRRKLVKAADTDRVVLWRIARGQRGCGYDLAIRLKQADPRITDRMLRPDLFDEMESKR